MGRKEHGRGINYICFCRMLVVKGKSQIIFFCSWIFWRKDIYYRWIKNCIPCVLKCADCNYCFSLSRCCFHLLSLCLCPSEFILFYSFISFCWGFRMEWRWNIYVQSALVFKTICIDVFICRGKKMMHLSVLIIFWFLIVVK